MDYQRVYNNIVVNASLRPVIGYTEKHHIIPRSWGGTNNKDNIVRLTAREHFICHYLLCKIAKKETPNWYSAIKAFNMMVAENNKHQRYMNSRLYESLRKHMSETMSYLQSGYKNSQFGTCWIYKDGISQKIKQFDLSKFVAEGWIRGRKPSRPKKEKRIKVIKRQASIGDKNSQYGSIWINDGVSNKKLSKGCVIPTGWNKGRIMNLSPRMPLRFERRES